MTYIGILYESWIHFAFQCISKALVTIFQGGCQYFLFVFDYNVLNSMCGHTGKQTAAFSCVCRILECDDMTFTVQEQDFKFPSVLDFNFIMWETGYFESLYATGLVAIYYLRVMLMV